MPKTILCGPSGQASLPDAVKEPSYSWFLRAAGRRAQPLPELRGFLQQAAAAPRQDHWKVEAPKQTCSRAHPKSAMHAQEAISSRSSAIHNDTRVLIGARVKISVAESFALFEFNNHLLQEEQLSSAEGSEGPMTMNNIQNNRPWRSSEYAHSPITSTCANNSTSSGVEQSSRLGLDSANDPSARSPTETLLRLLLPLSDKVHEAFQRNVQKLSVASVRTNPRITQSVGRSTGGVNKGQGRNQHELMTRVHYVAPVERTKMELLHK